MAPTLPRRLLPWLRTPPSSAAAAFSSAPSRGCPLHAALARRGVPAAASLALYSRIREAASPPTPFTFSLLLAALASSSSSPSLSPSAGAARLAAACLAHAQAFKCGALGHPVVTNSLLKLYCSLGLHDRARRVLDSGGAALDVVSWNTMVSGYGKGGDLGAAREVFAGMPERNLVSWSAMVDACVRAGEFGEALWVFDRMMGEKFRPDVVVLVSVLKACAHLGAVERGRWVHRYLETGRFGGRRGNVMLETALVDMYCKCGCMEEAWQVFDGVQRGDVVLWNAMIGGLAMNGYGERALELFRRMLQKGFMPNESTFIAVLCACTHTGRVDEGKRIFKSMQDYGIKPQREHYGCLADLLGRAGNVEEAEALLLDMPMEPHASQWGALMSSCQMHNDINVGERVGKRLIELEPYDGGRYVVLFNLYAVNGRWEEARTIRQMMEERGAKKETGLSFIEWNGLVHEFISGDTRHPITRKMYALLEDIERRLQLIGYVKDTSQVIMDMDDEEDKGIAVSYHSERLALAFGILNIPQGVPIRIVKNLRVCRDCHVHSKLVSKLYQREIIVRDRHRFHVFRDGVCSCNDYWFANDSWVDLFETAREQDQRWNSRAFGVREMAGRQTMESKRWRRSFQNPFASTLKLSPLLCFPHSICDSFLFHLHPKNSHPLHLFITPSFSSHSLSFFLMDYSGGGPATGRARALNLPVHVFESLLHMDTRCVASCHDLTQAKHQISQYHGTRRAVCRLHGSGQERNQLKNPRNRSKLKSEEDDSQESSRGKQAKQSSKQLVCLPWRPPRC
uniref:DYW domain-containing protein n=3 Tax=Oryza meridionalis TaxID=40149 RepID=A0A0E0CLU6_9ORYZ